MITLTIRTDVSAISPFFDALLADLSKAPFEVRKLFVDRLSGLPELICLNTDARPTAAAGEVWVCLKPSNALLELVAAFRAGDLDGLVVKDAHGGSSGVGGESEKAV